MTAKTVRSDRWVILAKSPLFWILGLQLLLAVPFVGQPIHQDDHVYIDIGRNALASPAHAHDFSYCFEGACVPDMASHSHPPFVGYFIGMLLWLTGDGPQLHIKLHIAFLVFPLLFAMGMYRLAMRFTSSPIFATLLAVTSPAAMVNSHTVMTNYPTLALWTIGLALYVDGVDQKRSALVWISGVFLMLAAFSSYPALLATGLCWVYALVNKSRMRAAYWAPSLAVVWMATWLIYSSVYFDRFVLADTVKYFLQDKASLSSAVLTQKLLGIPIFLGGVLVLPLPLIRRAYVWKKGVPMIVWIVLSSSLGYAVASGYSMWERSLLVIFLGIGGCILLGVLLRISESLKEKQGPELRQDAFFLAVWVTSIIATLLFVYSYTSARYILPMLPPIVLLAFLKSSRPISPSFSMTVAGLSFALLLGLSLSIADFSTARVYQDIAHDLETDLKGWELNTRFGGEWGFRYYMQENGFRQFVSSSDDFVAGEFVIIPHQAVPYTPPQDVASMLIPVEQRTWQSGSLIQLMNSAAHAGFYSSGWGLLPFSFSLAPAEGVTIQQVSYLVEKLPEITFEHADEEKTIIPRIGRSGVVELLVPIPGTLSIPYDGPLPAAVQFSCQLSNGENEPDCPIRVFYEHNGSRSEVNLQLDEAVDRSTSTETPLQFQLTDTDPGMIIIEIDNVEDVASEASAVLRNWLVLPPGGLR